nr:hypothetical protein [Lentilactobacillus rapi]
MIDQRMKIDDFNKEILAYPSLASDVTYLV